MLWPNSKGGYLLINQSRDETIKQSIIQPPTTPRNPFAPETCTVSDLEDVFRCELSHFTIYTHPRSSVPSPMNCVTHDGFDHPDVIFNYTSVVGRVFGCS